MICSTKTSRIYLLKYIIKTELLFSIYSFYLNFQTFSSTINIWLLFYKKICF